MDILIVLLRTIFFYFFILFSYRIMGKREIGQLSISDLTISILIAELVAISIENRQDATILTILPIILLVFLEVVLAYIQLKFNKVRPVMDGKPSVIILDGKLNVREMVKQRYSLDDLLMSLRENQIKGLNEIDYAILETNGKLSVFKKDKEGTYPLPLIIDGVVDNDSLLNINKTTIWLNKLLDTHDLSIDKVLYAFYKKNKLYIIRK
ncbi:MAG: DUF421 domain-containing protein [Erysipelotrichales bacterium]|nr:DUF421 domain-containing protein [Erysipelotrichales bacterium]